ncbi:ParB/RepB/Spo0J family partition protein (plasmid) [Burkholderia humptydooensis]|uniref:ParB/RepB/Spo0J family partition protein n=1 Tax=Burkholderia humptydooensis TaxID=430531 RepID=A0A7U4P7P8_9BURK|nr:ParB/RepB/Spo0J family partition protein [Burkholderia humptydooensis]ALX44523.1 nuclease [Burkholderia humptydooensis]QPS41877.1 ParB/RepB/Spo0J family partition protein [Burkholderia humptydooensis]
MSAVTTEIPALAHDAGVPPAPPEAHRTADDTRDIPLKRLVASPYNVRRVPPTGIKELAFNIWHSGGLLQNLVVHAMKVGSRKAQKFGVAAGERRRLALVYLLEHDYIADDYPVRCLVVPVKDAVLLSATENEMREPMHPADACDAYRILVESGRSIEDIAGLYGVHTKTVQRRLKLARVSPKLADLFRAGEIKLDQMQALALSDSHDEQEAAWFEAEPYNRDAHTIRRRFVRDEQSFVSNRVAKFVGVEAFEAAGGAVRRDLFSATEDAWYRDHALMLRIATEQLEAIGAPVLAEGWAWVKALPECHHVTRSQFAPLMARRAEPCDEAAKELVEIEQRLAEIATQLEADDTDDKTYERLVAEEDALTLRSDEIEESLLVYHPDDMARAGAIVTLDSDGEPVVERGLVTREPADTAAHDDDDRDSGNGGGDSSVGHAVHVAASDAKLAKGPHSERLTLRLNARRTAAVAAALAKQPHVALAALVHRLMAGDYGHSTEGSALDVTFREQSYNLTKHAPELDDDLAHAAHLAQRRVWAGVIPNNSDALLRWLIEQTDERLLLILAQYVASSVDGVSANERPHAINALIPALGLNLANVWQPTKASYFNHVSKQRIVEIVSVVVSPAEGVRLAKLTKADAATEAERLMAGRGWLPEHFANPEALSVELWDRRQEADPTEADGEDAEERDSDADGAADRDADADDDRPY